MRLILLCLLLTLPILADEKGTEWAGKFPYPLDVCLTCGDKLADSTVTLYHGSRELKFCCVECVASYAKSTKTYILSLQEQIRIRETGNYPYKICPVSGHELGSMGDPIEYVSGNTLVKFCCAVCIEKFESDPNKYLGILAEREPKPDKP